MSLKISSDLEKFTNNELLPELGISSSYFWESLEKIIDTFTPRNIEVLKKRDHIQAQIDDWHKKNRDSNFNKQKYKNFLKEIGYIKDEPESFSIETSNVDPEIKTIAGPQLVVPVMNARFALNAANARWGSLYDALYGSDVISEEGGAEKGKKYNPIRGHSVIKFAKGFLDETIPLVTGSFSTVKEFQFVDNKLSFVHQNESITTLQDEKKYRGFYKTKNGFSLLFVNNNLHFEIQVDRTDSIGADDIAGIKDIYIESAITTIQDCEDSVAAVDGYDKTIVYRNWLGLMKGNLEEEFIKNEQKMLRVLNPDREYLAVDGSKFTLPGRSMMLVRNVGHLMTNPAILDNKGNEVFEGIMDAFYTICCGLYDLKNISKYNNSKSGSMYIVKPKMHGPEEVQLTCDLFAAIENVFDLKPNTVKIGIMDEERRTTVNLKECIRIAKQRVIFINTGFLDRTGDEIHTSMEAGPVIKKADIKNSSWILAYEDWNVDTGLETGFRGRAQIGKGMWPMPDEMLKMYESKTDHLESGANCAWVPSPTAASLHALHYHRIFVDKIQEAISSREKANLNQILEIPLLDSNTKLSNDEIKSEIENNCQGILGYVVRWIDQGVGCSKVPDINNIGLMEDRATCRISSQHIANWLHHGICNESLVIESMKKMAKIVDEQNSNDKDYKKMSPNFNGFAFNAACRLALEGREQPNGYTEPILHEMRIKFKQNN